MAKRRQRKGLKEPRGWDYIKRRMDEMAKTLPPRINHGNVLDLRVVAKKLKIKYGSEFQQFEDGSWMLQGVILEPFQLREYLRLALHYKDALIWFRNSVSMSRTHKRIQAENFCYLREEAKR